jgi:uncharacterized protein
MTEIDRPRPEGLPCWLDLGAPDVGVAADFYAQVLGWDYDVSGPEFGHYHVARVGDRNVAGLGQPLGDAPASWTVYFAADDADAMAARVEALGGSVLAPPFAVPGQGRMAIVADPGGAPFGLWQATGHAGVGLLGAPGAMTWCEVATPDAERARAFYKELLGATDKPVSGAGTAYYALARDGEDFGGILEMTEAWRGIPPHWMVYFQVDDADHAAASVTEAGGNVLHGPFDTEFGRMVIATDPSGATFSLMGPRAGG